jgi:hypothetical protein
MAGIRMYRAILKKPINTGLLFLPNTENKLPPMKKKDF